MLANVAKVQCSGFGDHHLADDAVPLALLASLVLPHRRIGDVGRGMLAGCGQERWRP